MQASEVLGMRVTLAFFAVVGSMMTLTISSVIGVAFSGGQPTESQVLTVTAAVIGTGGAIVLFRHLLSNLTLSRL